MEFKVPIDLHRLQAVVIGGSCLGAGICKVVQGSDDISFGWDQVGDTDAVGDDSSDGYLR
jgi:hypothetical protein